MKNINTTKYENTIKKIYIDSRENDRIEYALKQYTPFNPTKAQLDTGDYLFIGYDNTPVIFEYKTGADFLSSITTNHLHNQVYRMTNEYQYSFIIIECEDLKKEIKNRYYVTGQDISLTQINGAISTYNTVTTVLQTQTKYQAFDLMMRMAAKIITQKPINYKYEKKTPNYALNILQAMQSVNNKAEDIVNTLNLKTLTDIIQLTKSDLTSVQGIGDKTADKILRNIGEML